MRIKLIVSILIFTFLFNGCTKIELPEINHNQISNKPFIMGSVEYVKKIDDIAKIGRASCRERVS